MRLRLYTFLPVVLGACGDCGSQHEPADSALADTGRADASTDAPRGVVELSVYVDGAAFPNAPVLFLDAADAVVPHTITQGGATAIMTAGGSVTVVLPGLTQPPSPQVFTYLDVKPGDHLVLGTPPAPPVITAPLTLPSHAGAASYRVAISCGTALPTLVSATCSPASFYVSAHDDMARPLAWFYMPSVAVTQGTAIDLSSQSFQALTPVQVTIAGVPSTVADFSIGAVAAVGDFTFALVEGAATPSLGAQRTVTLGLPAIAAADMVIIPNVQRNDTKDKQEHYVRMPFATTATIDVSTPTPWLKNGIASATTNEIQLYEDGTGAMDVALVRLQVERSFDDSYFWTVAGPYTPGKLDLPKLSGSFEPYNVRAGDDARHSGFAYTARISGGWDGLRAQVMNSGSLLSRLLRVGGVVATVETSTFP